MMVFSGSEGCGRGLATMRRLGCGRLVTAAGWRKPIPGIPWVLDNGAFSAFRQGRAFDGPRFLSVLEKVRDLADDELPLFGVAPDIVEGDLESLAFSLSWLPALTRRVPWYLAVQDGMSEADVDRALATARAMGRPFAGVFVGGSVRWKHRTAEAWVKFAHARGLLCHIGRVGTRRRLVWAERIGADSVDSTSWARNDTYHLIEDARRQARLTAGG